MPSQCLKKEAEMLKNVLCEKDCLAIEDHETIYPRGNSILSSGLMVQNVSVPQGEDYKYITTGIESSYYSEEKKSTDIL